LKNKGDDNRALLEENYKKLLPEGELHPFVELVKNHNELELCFRGNGKPEKISIYCNNHQVLKIDLTGIIYVSFNHARYCENWMDYLKKLVEFGFAIPDNPLQKGKRDNIGELKRYSHNIEDYLSYAEVEKLYIEGIKPIFDRFFEVNGQKNTIDYFKKETGISPYIVTPYVLTEKIRQQKLYSAMVDIKGGYFFYDLEFAQKHKCKKDQEDDKANNKPDMQAIKFNISGKPEKLVFVEVKCTKAAWNGGTSGLKDHVERMRDYQNQKNNMQSRREEACEILRQYAGLGLRNLKEDMKFDDKDFSNLELEILVVLTDEAKKKWDKDLKIDDIKKTASPYFCESYPEAEMFVM
jgi:hypothetical protein